MSRDTIKCPQCNESIPLTEALSREINESFKVQYEAREKEREREFKKREEELRKKTADVDKLVAEKVTSERARFELQARTRAKEEAALRISALEEETRANKKLLAEANEKELAHIREKRAFEDEKRDFELKVARSIEEERKGIREKAEAAFMEEHRLKDLEKEKKMQDMQKIIEDLKRKSEQGSMQTQGEVMELDLEAALKIRFPFDEILPVPKGIRGADIIQKVKTNTGHHCGTIIWELKRTKAWGGDWLTKLKDDQREVGADIAVIASEAMPKEINSFGFIDRVWVTGYHLAPNLAEALRTSLVQIAHVRQSAVGKEEKMEAIFKYLSGQEFRHKVEAIVESFTTMKEELEKEKRSAMKTWAKRDKQIERVLRNTVSMYGDLEGIIGAALPPIKTLELEEGSDEEERSRDAHALEEGNNNGKAKGLF
ncbi:MAG: DUF2130 domain-containing protein [Thermodesulfobacteriota bacterium]